MGFANLQVSKIIRHKYDLHKKKMVLIGGGEIATEITVNAFENKGWKIFIAVQDFHDKLPIEAWKKFLSKKKNLRPESYEKYVKIKKFSDFSIKYISEWIIEINPDIVILEDIFISPNDWKQIIKIVNAENPTVIFSPTEDFADVFLSKIFFKEFTKNVIKSDYLNYCVLDISKLFEEISGQISKIEFEKFQKFLKKFPECIMKPEKTSSGIGQSFVSTEEELIEGLKFLKSDEIVAQLRISNEKVIIEEYISDFNEYCIVSYINNNELTILYPIKYEKYGIKNPDLKGINPLLCSGMVAEDEFELLPDDQLIDIIIKIHQNLNVPFLYTEFFVLNNNDNIRIIINEISHRPDDAGFITLFSLEKSQFDIFLDSILNQNTKFDSCDYSFDNFPDTDLICLTLITEKDLSGTIIFPQPGEKRHKRNIRIYDTKYRYDWNVIGFLFCSKNDDQDIYKNFFKYLSDFSSEESIQILQEAAEKANEYRKKDN